MWPLQLLRNKASQAFSFGVDAYIKPVPKRPWNSITMDFIEQLPASSGYTGILVVVCHLKKKKFFF
jgi:hypothetical protein